jgi:hypothetical protein
MKKNILKLTVIVATLASTSVITQAQTAATGAAKPSAPPPTAWEQWVKDTKNPTDWFNWGADFRLRDEYLPNTLLYNENAAYSEQNVIRFRSRLWASVTPVTNLSLNTRLSSEVRYFTKPAGFGPYGSVPKGFTPREGMEWKYGIFDNLNLKWNNVADQPLSLTLGRQDIMLGDFFDWWLVSDGTPNDGSWTFYFDAARLTFDAKDIKTKFDVIYIHQDAMPDEWLPTLGHPRYTNRPRYPGTDYWVTEQNEQGVVFYVSNKSIKNTTIDGYFIYKRDDRAALMKRGAFQHQLLGDNADIYTIGGKITGTPAEHWQYSVEGAYQFGRKEDATVGAAYINSPNDWRDISAYGGKAKLTYLFKDQLNNQVSLVGEFLSGDDPKTKGKDEMFDVLWGRWPRWSELYIYSYATETSSKFAQMNNLFRLGPSWTFNPMKRMTFSAMYNALFAPEKTPTRCVAPAVGNYFSYDGHFRGHYLQTILKYQFNKNWSAHLWGEVIWEGNYYAQRDVMMFLRPEIMFTF